MKEITSIVKRSFDNGDKIRITNNINLIGASSVISAVYNNQDAEERKFYRKPKLAEGNETKLAILYGETMITPYIIDIGSSAGTNDPASIVKTIRFVAGDGETVGVVPGPNGSQLENVYLGRDNSQPQPVINDDGKPTTKDILLGAALGGVISNIPNIWNAIMDDSNEEVTDIDPITGGKIVTQAEKELRQSIAKTIGLGDLYDVIDSNAKQDYILVYENCTKTWVAKHISEVLNGQIQVELTGGQAGEAGTPGTQAFPGFAGLPPTPAYTIEPSPANLPQVDDLNQPTNNTQAAQSGLPMVGLIDISQLEENEYFEVVDVLRTDGMTLHFYFDGIKKEKQRTLTPDATTDATSDMPCLTVATEIAPGEPEIIHDYEGRVEIGICLSVEVCGFDWAFYVGKFIKDGYSEHAFSDHVKFTWENIRDFDNLIKSFPRQIINEANPNIRVRLRRIDGGQFGGDPKSDFPVYFQGYDFDYGDYFLKEYTRQDVPPVAEQPVPVEWKDIPDDGFYPEIPPGTSTLQAETCPVPQPIVVPASPGVDPIPPSPAIPGTPCTPCLPPTAAAVSAEPKVLPTLTLKAPLNGVYCKDADASNAPNVYDQANTVEIQSVNANTGNPNITIVYKIRQGLGQFVIEGTLPAGVTSQFAASNTELRLTGASGDMPAASQLIKIQPADRAAGEILYQIVAFNEQDGCDGKILTLVPCELSVENSVAACAHFVIDTTQTDEGTIEVFASMPDPNNDNQPKEKLLTSSPVPKVNGMTPEQLGFAIKANIDNNVATKNALPVTDPDWLPAFTVTTEGTKVIVCAPAAAGEDFNGFCLRLELTGAVGIDWLNSLVCMNGGVTKTTPPPLPENDTWGPIADVLLGIGANAAGAVVANILFNNSSTLSITIPEDEADVDITFLYRGRKVKMPSSYNGEARTGSPDWSSWSAANNWDADVGTKKEWTDNPAWCLLDYIENERFGLGTELKFSPQQKALLLEDIFAISQYCDEIADDGDVRFRLNTAITDGTKIEILEQLCSVFFGSFIFHNGGLRIRADKPDTSVKLLVCQANTDDLIYENTTLKSFANKVTVTYVEPANFYNETTVSVENDYGISKYGEKELTTFAFGVTNRNQALRYANWLLNSELYNSLIVTYTAGWDHYNLVPGDIVQFEDSTERLQRLAGRIRSISGTSVVLDQACVVSVGDSFSVMMDNGLVHETTVSGVTSPTQITIAAAPSNTVSEKNVFIIADQTVGKQYYRVVKVNETRTGIFNVTLQYYFTDKYTRIVSSTRSA